MTRAKTVRKSARKPGRSTSRNSSDDETTAAAQPEASRPGRRGVAVAPANATAPVEHAAAFAARHTAAFKVADPAEDFSADAEVDMDPDTDMDADADELAELDATPAPPILIQIEPTVAGGFIHGRFDLQLRGRVASSATITEVELETDGVVVARTVFGQPERAPSITLPDGTTGRQRS